MFDMFVRYVSMCGCMTLQATISAFRATSTRPSCTATTPLSRLVSEILPEIVPKLWTNRNMVSKAFCPPSPCIPALLFLLIRVLPNEMSDGREVSFVFPSSHSECHRYTLRRVNRVTLNVSVLSCYRTFSELCCLRTVFSVPLPHYEYDTRILYPPSPILSFPSPSFLGRHAFGYFGVR